MKLEHDGKSRPEYRDHIRAVWADAAMRPCRVCAAARSEGEMPPDGYTLSVHYCEPKLGTPPGVEYFTPHLSTCLRKKPVRS